MSETEHLGVIGQGRPITAEEIRELTGAATPHFALQLRNRVARLIEGLPEGNPARAEGERQIARLEELADLTTQAEATGDNR